VVVQKAVAVWQGKARDSGAPITTFEVQAGSGHTALVD